MVVVCQSAQRAIHHHYTRCTPFPLSKRRWEGQIEGYPAEKPHSVQKWVLLFSVIRAILDHGLVPTPIMTSFLPSFHFGGKRKRRHRTIFSEEQLQVGRSDWPWCSAQNINRCLLQVLEATFTETHYPDVSLREKLAIQCDLKEERVEVGVFVASLSSKFLL